MHVWSFSGDCRHFCIQQPLFVPPRVVVWRGDSKVLPSWRGWCFPQGAVHVRACVRVSVPNRSKEKTAWICENYCRNPIWIAHSHEGWFLFQNVPRGWRHLWLVSRLLCFTAGGIQRSFASTQLCCMGHEKSRTISNACIMFIHVHLYVQPHYFTVDTWMMIWFWIDHRAHWFHSRRSSSVSSLVVGSADVQTLASILLYIMSVCRQALYYGRYE